MKITEHLPKLAVLAVMIGGAVVLGTKFFGTNDAAVGAQPVIPEYSDLAKRGEALFQANCAQCHGVNTVGTDQGPPFLHPFYNPGHHGDRAFLAAVRNGVRAHHWNFGDMPPQPQVSSAQLRAIVAYVREIQVANGIVYQKHKM